MKMTARTRLVGGVTIVDLSGRIVLGEGSAGLRDLLRNLVREGIKKILLNLRNVGTVPSQTLFEHWYIGRQTVVPPKAMNCAGGGVGLSRIYQLITGQRLSNPP
jgi:hypothetical protein